MSQMKEQRKTLQEQINEEETGNLTEKEFRVMIVKISRISEVEWRHGLRKYKECLRKI